MTESRKSRFVGKSELTTVELEGGDWVKIPARLSFGFVEDFQAAQEKEGMGKVAEFLAQMIKEWNLVDDQGVIAPIDLEHLRALELKDVMDIATKINEKITDLVDVPKAESPQSNAPSEDTAEATVQSSTT